MIRFIPFVVALFGVLQVAFPAGAAAPGVIVLPVAQPERPVPADLGPTSRHVSELLAEALRDYGLEPRAPSERPPDNDADLGAWQPDSWVLSPGLRWIGGDLALRVAIRAPRSRVLVVREQRVTLATLEVATLGLLRELIGVAQPALRHSVASPPADAAPRAVMPAGTAVRSDGRAVLALHAATLGGYLGFSLQRASGSDDARLTYPLAALGAGVGLGASVVVSEEWDISTARAWYLGASMAWPGVGTLLAIEERDLDSPSEQYILGLVGAVGGLTLATAGLSLGDVGQGGAALTHSGGAFGLLLGGLGQMAIEGDAEIKPFRGMGVGAIVGSLVAGGAAVVVEAPSATDLLFIDVSALLGGLTGAALGTPILVSQDRSETRDRVWVSSVIAGTVAGAALGYWLTRGDADDAETTPPDAGGVRLHLQPGHAGRPLGFSLLGAW